MGNAKEILKGHIDLAERAMTEFALDNMRGAKALDNLREALSKKVLIDKEQEELYMPAVYNALATINSVPNTKIRSRQLIEAIKEAKAEMQAICDFLE